MGIFSAGAWPFIVDGTVVVREKQRAGSFPEYIIAVFVQVQILPYEISGLEAKVPGDPVNVLFLDDGTDAFAAIGTVQAVDHVECLFMQLLHQFFKL